MPWSTLFTINLNLFILGKWPPRCFGFLTWWRNCNILIDISVTYSTTNKSMWCALAMSGVLIHSWIVLIKPLLIGILLVKNRLCEETIPRNFLHKVIYFFGTRMLPIPHVSVMTISFATEGVSLWRHFYNFLMLSRYM